MTIYQFISYFSRVPISHEVPCACIYFEHEFVYLPSSFLRDKYQNLVHFKTYKSAGHFAALELSSVLREDIVYFVSQVEKNDPHYVLNKQWYYFLWGFILKEALFANRSFSFIKNNKYYLLCIPIWKKFCIETNLELLKMEYT